MKPTVYKIGLFLISMAFLIQISGINAVQADDTNSSSTTTSSQMATNTYNNPDNGTTSSNPNPTDNNSNSNPNSNPQPNSDTHKYYSVLKKTQVNYATIIRKNKLRYHNGAYNTNDANRKSFANTQKYLYKWVNVYELETTQLGTYAHVFYKGHDLGWIKISALDSSAYKINHVPLIGQLPQLPTGCEITAVTMMINYQNHSHIKKITLAKEMPRSNNPNKGFVGDPFKKSGWYIFPSALLKLVKNHLGTSKLFTGKSTHYLKQYLKKTGHPIVVYLGDIDNFPNHAVTMTGFDKHHIYFNDPWTKKRTSLTNNSFEYHRKYVHKKAVGY